LEPAHATANISCNSFNENLSNTIKLPDDLFQNADSVNCILKIKSDGYKTLSKNINIKKYSNIELFEVLKENQVILNFNSEPAFSNVYEKHLGYLGTTPFSYKLTANKMQNISANRIENEVNETKLYLVFQKDGYKDTEKSVVLNKNNPKSISVLLKK
jgi:hypothetical protein